MVAALTGGPESSAEKAGGGVVSGRRPEPGGVPPAHPAYVAVRDPPASPVLGYAHRFDEQRVDFPIRDGAALRTVRNHDHLLCLEDNASVSQSNRRLVSVVVSAGRTRA